MPNGPGLSAVREREGEVGGVPQRREDAALFEKDPSGKFAGPGMAYELPGSHKG